MLVLSRRSNERVVLPAVNVAVEVVQIKGNSVRLGIEAPPEVTVLRGELAARTAEAPPVSPAARAAAHSLCNRLSKLTLALHVVERQWGAGRTEEARATLAAVLDDLGAMDREWVLSHFTPPPPAAAPRPARCRTLVVDDDSNERELLAGLLKMHGCECETAPDGEAALDYLARHERPDLLLLDMWMPRCDGPRTVRQVRRDPRYAGMRVFAISGSSPEEVGLSTGPGGVDAWFPKPLNPRKLWDAIQAGLTAPAAGN